MLKANLQKERQTVTLERNKSKFLGTIWRHEKMGLSKLSFIKPSKRGKNFSLWKRGSLMLVSNGELPQI